MTATERQTASRHDSETQGRLALATSRPANGRTDGETTYRPMRITPALAQDFLQRKLPTRLANPTAIRLYAATMKEGRWRLNGESIIFDTKGQMIDGVQRLSACIAAGKDFITYVVENADPAIANTVDQHRRRRYVDLL